MSHNTDMQEYDRQIARRQDINQRLTKRGMRPAVIPLRPESMDSLRYLTEALRVGNDRLVAELDAEDALIRASKASVSSRGTLNAAAHSADMADDYRPSHT